MSLPFRTRSTPSTRPLTLITKAGLAAWLKAAPAMARNWVAGSGFTGSPGELCLVPGRDGKPVRALLGVAGDGAAEDIWHAASLPTRLLEGSWSLDPQPTAKIANRVAIGWALGAYAYTRYKKAKRRPAELVWPEAADKRHVTRVAEAASMVRDLINTPAEEMGPAELADAACDMAKQLGMEASVIKGDKLLTQNYPLIHAVGRASARAPRLIDLRWGDSQAPRVTIVGKGVCFDTGGLDLKSDANMRLMKKDMGGGALALGLARMIVDARLAVALRVLVPAVENSVSGNAFRPLDVIRSRQGLTVEIGNTDAEGRLILADALTEASSETPALIVDFATLTGAARAALGPDLPAMYCNDDDLAAELLRHAAAEADPLWRMPLWRPYRARLDSKVADLNNVSGDSFAGSVIAALFLQEFVGKGIPWVHLDIFAWSPQTRPGRPEGAEAQALRAVFALIAARFGARAAG